MNQHYGAVAVLRSHRRMPITPPPHGAPAVRTQHRPPGVQDTCRASVSIHGWKDRRRHTDATARGAAMPGTRLTTAWSGLTDWLRTSAPVSYEALRPPAPAGAFLPASTRLLSAEEIAAVHRGKCDMLDTEELVGVWWHPRWVPFAATRDALGCYFVYDRPGPRRGSVGYFFNEAGGQTGWWPTPAAFAEAVAEAVQDTRPVRSDVPRLAHARSAPPVLPWVIDGMLSWCQ
jgi:hypothetical protein